MTTAPLTLPHLAFTGDTSEDAARAAFERRYGQAPAQVVTAAGYVWAGPVPQNEGTDTRTPVPPDPSKSPTPPETLAQSLQK